MKQLDLLVEGSLAPVDALRSLLLRRLGALARPWLRDRHARIALIALVCVSLAFALAVRAPRTLLWLGPLVLGVPHLLGDVRYLVVRQGLYRRTPWVALVTPCLVMSIVEPRQLWGTLAVALSVLLAEAAWARRLPLCVAVLAAGYALHRTGHAADVVLAHLHNLVALWLWTRWSRRLSTWLPALFAFALASTLFASGVLDDALFADLAHADTSALAEALSPSSSPIWALRFVGFFAFAQAVHYAVWTRLIPEHDRAREGVRSFRASYRALQRDLGGLTLAAALALALGLALAGLLDASLGRALYLRVALFHGPLELAVLMLLAVEGRALSREAADGR